MVPVDSPQIAVSSPSRTLPKKRLRLSRNVQYTWDLPPPTVLQPQFPTFKAAFKHWAALFDRRDLDASERTEDMTDYDYWPELEGKEEEYSIDEEMRMRWNARKMREGAFERYRKVTAKFTPQRRIKDWVEKQGEVSSYDESVSPVKTVIRLTPEMRQALTAQQLSAKKAKANYHATVAKAKTDAKLHLRPAVRPDENARPVPSPTPLRGKERTPLAVVDMAGPRTRSSGRKAAAAATGQAASFVLAPEPKAALKAPAKPLGLKRKHVEDPTPAVADERPAKKSRGKPKAATTEIRRKATGSKEVLFAQLAVGRARQEGLEPPADALKIVESRRHLGPILSGPGPARAAASAVASVQPAVIPMEEGVPTPAVPTATQTHVSQMDESPTHPAVQHASPKQEAPAVKTRAKRAKKALELPARGSTLNRGTARILLTQLQVQQATTDAERTAANTELAEATAPKIVSQTRYALRERRTLASTPKSQDMTHHSVVEDQRRCRGCKHLFSTTQGLARHKQGKRTRPDCRA